MAAKDKSSVQSTTTSTPVSQLTLKESIERSQKYERKGKKWQELTQAVTHYIAKDNLPIHSVEKDGFKKLLHTFDGRYEVPTRSYFSRTALPTLYTTTKDRVRREISTLHYFSATTDFWSSEGMQPFMSYTVHFVDTEWKLQNRCLETQFLPQDHTGENLAESIKAALESWDLDILNQVCLTTDNGSNIISAVRQLGILRLSCFGHNLHLAITKALKDDHRCSRAISICRKIVSTFSMSWKKKRELTKAQINLGLHQHSFVAVSLHFFTLSNLL